MSISFVTVFKIQWILLAAVGKVLKLKSSSFFTAKILHKKSRFPEKHWTNQHQSCLFEWKLFNSDIDERFTNISNTRLFNPEIEYILPTEPFDKLDVNWYEWLKLLTYLITKDKFII